MEDNNKRILKQEYLRTEILDLGYDTEKFVKLIGEKKEDGTNIDNWTMSELMKVVEIFKESNKPNQKSDLSKCNEDIPVKDRDSQDQQFQQDIEDNDNNGDTYNKPQIVEEQKQNNQSKSLTESQQIMQSANIQKYGVREDYYEQSVKAIKHESLTLYYDKIRIQILDPTRKTGGLFGITSHYILFKIITKPYNWEVKRKMKDFVWLKTVLQKLFPGNILPPLDTKNNDKDKHTQGKRMKFLQYFINDLKYTQEIWTSRYVVSFLSETDDKKFEQLQKESEKEREIENISNLTTLSGYVNVKISKENYLYKEELDKYISSQEKIYGKLHNVSKQLQKDFSQLSNTLNQMGILYQEQLKQFTEFGEQIHEGKEVHNKVQEKFQGFSNLMLGWGRATIQQTKQITDQITHFFKYNWYETKCYKELITRANEVEKTYLKFKQQLQDKKDKLFRFTKDPTKWEITTQNYDANEIKKNKKAAFEVMYTKDTNYQNQLRDSYGYFLNCVFEESQKSLKKKVDYYNNFFKIFALKEIEIFNDQLKQWGPVLQSAGFNPYQPIQAPQRQSIMIQEDDKIFEQQAFFLKQNSQDTSTQENQTKNLKK